MAPTLFANNRTSRCSHDTACGGNSYPDILKDDDDDLLVAGCYILIYTPLSVHLFAEISAILNHGLGNMYTEVSPVQVAVQTGRVWR